MMFNFTYEVNGHKVTVKSRDQDRARCAAKKAMGPDWNPKAAKPVKISNAM